MFLQDITIHRFSNHHFQQKSKSLPKQPAVSLWFWLRFKKKINKKPTTTPKAISITIASLITYSDSSSGGGLEQQAADFQVAGHWLQSLVNSMVGDSSGTLEM